MTNQKLITICIPTYNRSKTVTRLIQELLDFELNDQIEILVLDDGSQDNTFEELSKFSHYNNVSIFKNEKNIGLVGSVLRCFNLCKTEYLIEHADDDILYKDGILELLSLLPTLDADFLATRWTRPNGPYMRGSDKVIEISLTNIKGQSDHLPGGVFRASILRFSEQYILERLDKNCALAFFFPQTILLFMAKLNNLKLYSSPILLGGYRPEGSLPKALDPAGNSYMSYMSLSVSFNIYLGMKHFYEDMLTKFYDSPLVDELKVLSDAHNLNLYNIIDDAVCLSDDSESKSLGENLRAGSIKNIFNPIKGFRYLVRFFIVKLKALRYK